MSVFDAHLHVVDPRFPLEASPGYRPGPFTADDYRARVRALGVVGGAVVSGSFHGFHQGHLEDALERLGAGFVGVTQLPPDVTDAEVRRLDAKGVRAVRFNIRRGGSAGLSDLERLAFRVHRLAGWHVELYIDAAGIDGALFDRIARLPAVCIDHLGLSAQGLPTLLRLVERGVRVKASGFGRVDFDVADALRRIASVDPAAAMFGTDLPSTRSPRPFDPADIALVRQTLGPDLARRVLHDNARDFYGPRPAPESR